MRHALRASRKVVLSLAVLSTAAVWSTPVTAQPHETPASPEQQAQDGHDIQNYMNDAPVDIGIQNDFSNPVRCIRRLQLEPEVQQHDRRIDGEHLELGC